MEQWMPVTMFSHLRAQNREEESAIQESIEAQERAEEEALANCPHENYGDEPVGPISASGTVEIMQVCYDCGAQSRTGRFDSVM